MAFMETYKPGQGKQARTFAALVYVFVTAWMCYAFMEYGNSRLDRLLGSIFGYDTPIFAQPVQTLLGASGDEVSGMTGWLTLSFAVAIGLFIVMMAWGYRLLNRPKVADHLIGTELEMRRVKWPGKAEVARAGSIVVYYVFWLAVIILLIDLVMNTVIGMLLGQSWDEVGIGKIVAGIIEFFTGTKG
ncbi:MAG: preprotein translocase subunit SecE [Planctomycetes bacterium]|nr:preprotein translocase subunit SecE [Planctomycetota bacterium]NUQ33992.1 preprotein translocase subunit SecE [Planctomycetaceae bacterium]